MAHALAPQRHHHHTTDQLASGKRYRGINVLALWIAASTRGYREGLWAPIPMAGGRRAGPQGRTSTTVVLWKELRSRSAGEDTPRTGRRRAATPGCRAFNVFNRGQVDNYNVKEPPPRAEPAPIAQAGPSSPRSYRDDGGLYDAHYRIKKIASICRRCRPFAMRSPTPAPCSTRPPTHRRQASPRSQFQRTVRAIIPRHGGSRRRTHRELYPGGPGHRAPSRPDHAPTSPPG